MAIRNQHSPKAAMIAALDTRRAKQADPGAVELRARWARARRRDRLRPGRPARRDRPHRADADRPTPSDAAVEDRLLGADGLTAHDSSFDRNDILRAWCDALPAGAPIERHRGSRRAARSTASETAPLARRRARRRVP